MNHCTKVQGNFLTPIEIPYQLMQNSSLVMVLEETSEGFILWGSRISLQNFMAIHLLVVEIFPSGWHQWNNQLTLPSPKNTASMAHRQNYFWRRRSEVDLDRLQDLFTTVHHVLWFFGVSLTAVKTSSWGVTRRVEPPPSGPTSWTCLCPVMP